MAQLHLAAEKPSRAFTAARSSTGGQKPRAAGLASAGRLQLPSSVQSVRKLGPARSPFPQPLARSLRPTALCAALHRCAQVYARAHAWSPTWVRVAAVEREHVNMRMNAQTRATERGLWEAFNYVSPGLGRGKPSFETNHLSLLSLFGLTLSPPLNQLLPWISQGSTPSSNPTVFPRLDSASVWFPSWLLLHLRQSSAVSSGCCRACAQLPRAISASTVHVPAKEFSLCSLLP